ncbi:hypothetical protein [Aminobacter sp. BE322]|uniref:hypothetical protein n=1 Tax=unclassified Aminobacter TaxID=2644704 RepID=UPI003D212DFA
MPIASNRHYNDPALGQAFNNLAQMFAPPSGSDLAGYATAKAKREEATRLAELFDYARDPAFQQQIFDRLGQATGTWTPSTGYYGVDVNARTSRSNNAADNARALQTNAADNARALEQTRLQNTKDITTKMLDPVAAGATRFVPSTIAGMYDVPERQIGVISANPGERIVTPDGRTIEGATKPMSETEWQATQAERLLQSGALTDQMLADAIVGERAPVKAVGPDGKTPVFMTPGEAARTAAQPFVEAGSQAKPANAVALMPDGKTRVPAVQDPDGRWVHAQTRQPLPESIQIFDLPKATGTAADVGLAPTTANETQANNQEAEVTRALNLLDIYEQMVQDNPGSIGLAGLIRGTAQNAAATAADLATSFGKSAPQMAEAAEELKRGLQGVAPEFFTSAIPEIEFLQGTLAYSLARTENPSGEVSRQAFERALERVKGGGLLANRQSALAAIGANRKVLQTQLDGIRTLRAPGTGRTDTGFRGEPTPPAPPAPPAPNGGAERWERGPDGRLRKVQ